MSNFWKIFISVVATIIVVGGGIYYLMQRQISSIQNDNQAKMDDLNKQIATLKSTSATSTSTPATTTPTTTADPTAGWKTYTNNAFGFSVKYPSDYIASNASSYSANDGVFIKTSSSSNKVLVSIEGVASTLSLDDYVAAAVKDSSFSESAKTTFASQPAYEGIDNGMLSSYGIIVKKGGNVFRIVLDTGNVDGLTKSKAAISTMEKQILSTFQFTK